MKVALITIVLIALVLGLGYAIFSDRVAQAPSGEAITSFEDCIAAGNPVMESYPRQCRTPDGKNFVEDISSGPGEDLGLQANECAVAGCSGQLCVSALEAGDIVTTCEYRAEYACYREASCEPQANGKCGWTDTAELKQCLANPPALDE